MARLVTARAFYPVSLGSVIGQPWPAANVWSRRAYLPAPKNFRPPRVSVSPARLSRVLRRSWGCASPRAVIESL